MDDKDQIKGKLDDAIGRAKRQAGEWTDNKDLETEGAKDQAKGKAENVMGKVKDAARNIKDDLTKKRDRADVDRDDDDKEDVA
jgi:uncharacterized protein YjbJ (UPF0337 family)